MNLDEKFERQKAETASREEVRETQLENLREKIRVGVDQLQRGEGREWDVETIKAKGRALLSLGSGAL